MNDPHGPDRARLDDHLRRLRDLLAIAVTDLRRSWADDPMRGPGVIGDEEVDRLLGPVPDTTSTPGLPGTLQQTPGVALDAPETPPTPPGLLAARLGLTAGDLDVVLLCLAPHLDPAFGRLYAYVQDDASAPHATHATPALAHRLLGTDPSRFLEASPLRRLAVLRVDDVRDPAPLANRPLHLDERVVAFLLGEEATDARLQGLLEPIPHGPASPEHETCGAEVVAWLHEASEAPLLDLRGATATGRRVVAARVARGLGLRVAALRTDQIPEPGPHRRALLRLLARESLLARTAYLVDGDLEPPPDDVLACGALVWALSQDPWRAPTGLLRVDVPEPDASARARLWREALQDQGVEPDAALRRAVDQLAQQVRVAPHELPRIVRDARRQAHRHAKALDAEGLGAACREHVAVSLGDTARRIRVRATLDDLVLPPDAAQQLHEIVCQVRGRTQVYDAWGFAGPDARGRGISVLFGGASGTGKTLAAEALANELGLELYSIDLATVVSKYIGETEKNLRRVFDAAERSGVLLFFDEADALFGTRTEVRDSHDRYANLEVDYLLQRMESYRGLAVLATNRKSALDAAFLRRLRFQVEFPFPDARARALLWQKVFPEAVRPDLDWDQLALLELSGAGIRNTALNAAFLAAARDPPVITQEDVFHAAKREFAKLERTPDRAAFAPKIVVRSRP